MANGKPGRPKKNVSASDETTKTKNTVVEEKKDAEVKKEKKK